MYNMTTPTTPNPASNYANLAALSSQILAYNDTTQNITVQNAIENWLTKPTEAADTYEPMKNAIFNAQTALGVGNNSTLRVLLAMSDGTVAIDTSKSSASNTYLKFKDKAVNVDNHNTRPEIMIAVLGSSGVGISDRFSTSVSTTQKYQATRMGASSNTNLGTFRVSLNDMV